MSGGIFYLDEDRDKEPSPTESRESLRDSPSPQHSDPSTPPGVIAQPTPITPATSSTLQVPQSSSLLSQSPAFGRKSGVFAATPSFPSPLAQAITVPSHSDSSSSSAHSSPQQSDNEDADVPGVLDAATTRSRVTSAASKTRSNSSPSESTTASSSRRSSRPPSPAQPRQHILTPGALLMNRVKRSGSGSAVPPVSGSGPVRSSPPRISPGQRDDPLQGRPRSSSPSDSRHSASGSSGRGLEPAHTGGSSPLAFGSPDLEPAEPIASPRPVMAHTASRDRDSNILGLGWTPNWAETAAAGANREKPKGSYLRSPSPRKEMSSPIP